MSNKKAKNYAIRLKAQASWMSALAKLLIGIALLISAVANAIKG